MSDATGAYVLTNSGGGFDLDGDYACTAGTQVYIYSLGSDAGAGTNDSAGFMAAVGECPAAGNFNGGPP